MNILTIVNLIVSGLSALFAPTATTCGTVGTDVAGEGLYLLGDGHSYVVKCEGGSYVATYHDPMGAKVPAQEEIDALWEEIATLLAELGLSPVPGCVTFDAEYDYHPVA